MDNRAGEMEVFVAVCETRSFSAAGRRLRLSPSAVSKLVTRIEDRLGTRLLVRSTRSLQLTPEGEVYLQRAQRILTEIAETEQLVAAGGRLSPAGFCASTHRSASASATSCRSRRNFSNVIRRCASI